jgi:excisionase family DNA binding protein
MRKDFTRCPQLSSCPKNQGKTNMLFENRIKTDEPLLTKQEIATFLNVSVKMIDRKVYRNEIPYFKVGRLVRFSKERVLAWAEESTPKE